MDYSKFIAIRILKKMIKFLPNLQAIFRDVLMGRFSQIRRRLDLKAFWLVDVLKAEPEVHPCGDFDFIISEFNKEPRISELASLRLRGEDLYTPFHFQKQAGIHGNQQT